MKLLNDGIARAAFLISLTGNLLFLALPLPFKGHPLDSSPKKMTVAIELKEPSILPKIEKMGKERRIKRRIKKVENSKSKVKSKGLAAPPVKAVKIKHLSGKSVLRSRDIVKKKVRKKIRKKVVNSKSKATTKDFAASSVEPVKAKDLSGEAMLRFQDMVKRRIEKARYYPPRAKKRGWEGIVRVRFSILPDGRTANIRVLNPSGYGLLDEAAKRTIRQAAPFPPLPKTISFKPVEMEVSIVFTLN
jgi:protein TonB